MTVHASTDSFELGDYLGLLRRRVWVMLAFTCAGLLLGTAYSVVHHKTYTATASLFVNSNAANATELVGGRTSGAINMDNEAQIVQSDAVASLVAKQLGKVTSLANAHQAGHRVRAGEHHGSPDQLRPRLALPRCQVRPGFRQLLPDQPPEHGPGQDQL